MKFSWFCVGPSNVSLRAKKAASGALALSEFNTGQEFLPWYAHLVVLNTVLYEHYTELYTKLHFTLHRTIHYTALS